MIKEQGRKKLGFGRFRIKGPLAVEIKSSGSRVVYKVKEPVFLDLELRKKINPLLEEL